MHSVDVAVEFPRLDAAIASSPPLLAAETSVSDAIAALQHSETQCILIVETNKPSIPKLIGLFTAQDLAYLRQSEKNTIDALVARQVITLTREPTQTLWSAIALLHQHQIQHLPILDHQGSPIGIVTLESIYRALQPAHLLQLVTLSAKQAEQTIRERLRVDEIAAKKSLEAHLLRTQRLESLGTLASGIAHDLNNILTPILAIAQLLPLKLPNLDQHNRSLLEMLEINAKRGANLVKQVLSFGRGVEGDRTILQLRHLLLDLQQLVKQTFPKTITLEVTIPQDLWTVSADATQLHQVFLNLAVNARDAMPQGGTLSVVAENRVIDQQYAQMHVNAKAGSYSVITFTDTGTGIEPQIVNRIFEPFFTTKAVGKGTGLGLSTAIGIINNHGGFVEVSSEVGKGTQFRVFLPALSGSTSQPSPELQTAMGQGEWVLLVDDEPAIQQVLKATLETHGYRVMTASDGIDAIALYATHHSKLQVVLMDVLMPAMDGVTAIKTMQRLNPQVKIIAISGLTTNESLVQATGVTTFLPKPCTAEELLLALRQALPES